MKKIISIATLAVLTITMLASCGSAKCNMCEKSCSTKYSFKDGEVVLCKDCYKDCFEDKIEMDPETFFGAEEVAEEAAE